MSEKNNESIYQKQKTIRPKIEAVMNEFLDGVKLKNALKFITYLRENKMNPGWASGNSWKISYKNFAVCYIRFNSEAGILHIQPFIGEYEDNLISNELKEIVWANKKHCPGCKGGNCGLKIYKIFGKEYEGACERSIVFNDPDADGIECIKKLLEIRKNAIQEGKAKKHFYVAIKNR